MNDIIQDIRKRCRMQMDGIASASMRKKGLVYKLNFGVPIQEIKTISKRYEATAQLAQRLWSDETRELKILATMLYPIADFDAEIAQNWVKQIPNQEIREQLVFNLLQKSEDSLLWGQTWANSDVEEIRATGYWLLARLVVAKKFSEGFTESGYTYIWDDVLSNNFSLRNASILFLKNIGRLSKETCQLVLHRLQAFNDSDNKEQKAIYDSLVFEYQYIHD